MCCCQQKTELSLIKVFQYKLSVYLLPFWNFKFVFILAKNILTPLVSVCVYAIWCWWLMTFFLVLLFLLLKLEIFIFVLHSRCLNRILWSVLLMLTPIVVLCTEIHHPFPDIHFHSHHHHCHHHHHFCCLVTHELHWAVPTSSPTCLSVLLVPL